MRKEHEFIVQPLEDYQMNGYQKPQGEGWTFDTAISTEDKVVALWHRDVVEN